MSVSGRPSRAERLAQQLLHGASARRGRRSTSSPGRRSSRAAPACPRGTAPPAAGLRGDDLVDQRAQRASSAIWPRPRSLDDRAAARRLARDQRREHLLGAGRADHVRRRTRPTSPARASGVTGESSGSSPDSLRCAENSFSTQLAAALRRRRGGRRRPRSSPPAPASRSSAAASGDGQPVARARSGAMRAPRQLGQRGAQPLDQLGVGRHAARRSGSGK